MSGSFWKFSNGFSSLSNITTLLENYRIGQEMDTGERSNVYEVLFKLLDENDLLQELLSNNNMLLEFMREEQVLHILVNLVINEGKIDSKLAEELGDLHIDTSDQESGTNAKQAANSEEISSDKAAATEQENAKEDGEEQEDTKNHNASKDNNKDESAAEDERNEEEDDEEEEEEDEEDEEDEDEDEYDNEEEEESYEERCMRHANIAAEILSADVWSLTDTVMESTNILNKLWSILDTESQLSINLSTFFMKIMEHLLDMKCDEMITFLIEDQPNLVKKFMNHLSNPPLMDFLLKLIATDKSDNSTGIIDFLQNQDLITHLIDALNITDENNEPKGDYDILLIRQSSAADFLKALITISANSTTDNSTIGPNELTRELVSYDQMSRLCSIMLKGGYALANGVGIIIEIIRKNNSDYDILPVLYITLESHPPTGRDPIYLGHLLKVFGEKIEDFNKLLLNNDTITNKLMTTLGEIEPLGFERFKICELIAELLHCSNMALLNDNKGYQVVEERDNVRKKMKEYDPVSFKYNEMIVLPGDDNKSEDDYVNDTIDSFNSKIHHDDDSLIHQQDDENEEAHSNANLSEEEIRADPVVGDYLKIALHDTQIISNILSMFFRFPWNNFLHNVVFDIVQQVLNGSMDIGFNKYLAISLFHLGNITAKIIEGQKMCTEYENTNNGLRLGYMGHLTLIAEEVVKFIQVYPTNTLSELIDQKVEDEAWEEYVTDVLYDTREKYNAILGGGEEEEEEGETTHTFDEGAGEIIDSDYKPGLVLDPNTDHDIIGSGFEADDSKKHNTSNTSSLSDESESDDDDHFTNYMSQQLTNSASTEIISNVEGSEREDVDMKFGTSGIQSHESVKSITGDLKNDDEYIDPNDDGMSYKKAHPLYDSQGLLLSEARDDEYSSEDSTSSSDDDEEFPIDDQDDDVNDKELNRNKLTRSASKSS